MHHFLNRAILTALAALVPITAGAAPVNYAIDPEHSYPSFEADHMGVSTWRGKFNRTSGTVVLDREALQGTVEVKVAIDSIDFGNDALNEHALGADIFDAARYPVATYRGEFTDFKDGKPGALQGELTLHGVTRPLKLDISTFTCMINHPLNKAETCGADAIGTFNRGDFGVTFGLDMGFRPEVILRIQVEAIRTP